MEIENSSFFFNNNNILENIVYISPKMNKITEVQSKTEEERKRKKRLFEESLSNELSNELTLYDKVKIEEYEKEKFEEEEFIENKIIEELDYTNKLNKRAFKMNTTVKELLNNGKNLDYLALGKKIDFIEFRIKPYTDASYTIFEFYQPEIRYYFSNNLDIRILNRKMINELEKRLKNSPSEMHLHDDIKKFLHFLKNYR